MAHRKRKTREENPFLIVEQFAGIVDTLFVRYTGKTLGQHLREPQARPRELPPGEQQTTPSQPTMSLANAYAILGLKPGAPLEDVKKHYRSLANLFHPDRGGYQEAMILLNNAHERIIKREKGG